MAAPRVLEPDQLAAEFKADRLSPVYLLAGPDVFRIERAARWLRDKTVDDEGADFNQQTLHADEVSPAAIVEAASAFPMFGNARFVWVRHAEALPTGAAIEPLLKYLADPAPTTRLVLTSAKLDKRLKLTAACADAGRAVGFSTLSGRDLTAQVRRQAKEHELQLADTAIEALVAYVGEDLGELDAELAKLALHPENPGRTLGPDDIDEQVARSRDINAFALADALHPRWTGEALGLWIDYRQRGGDVMGGAAIVGWRIRQLAQLRAALDEGLNPQDAARRVGLSGWQARKVLPLAEATSRARIEATLTAWRTADRRAKSTSLGADLSFDLAILEWAAAPLGVS
jgi:DNA polymerase-3 subunit delta